MESCEDMGDDIPRTTSRTEVGSAKASRMNSCGIFGSAAFSMLGIQSARALGNNRVATRLTGCCLGEGVVDHAVLWLTCREAEWMDGDNDDGLLACLECGNCVGGTRTGGAKDGAARLPALSCPPFPGVSWPHLPVEARSCRMTRPCQQVHHCAATRADLYPGDHWDTLTQERPGLLCEPV